MKLYIDKSNVHSLLSTPEKGERFSSILKMIRNNLDVGFNFEKEEIKNDDVLMKFVTQFTTGRSTSLRISFTSEVMPLRPLEDNFLKSVYQNKRCVLLIDDINIGKAKKAGTCLIGGLGEEVEILQKLLVNVEDYDFDKELSIGEKEFPNWDVFAKYNHPFYDLLILDRYILKVDEATLKKNIIELLNQFHTDKKSAINIVLFTLKEAATSWKFKEIKNMVVDIIFKKTKITPNFTLVWSNDVKTARHDRHIISNYYWLKSGDSFNYFLASTGAVRTTGDTLNIKSLAKEDYRKAVDIVLEKTQEKISELIKLNPGLIEGDKISSFLKFTL